MSIKEVLSFWFGEIREEAKYLAGREKFWFGKSAIADAAIREKFGETLKLASDGKLDAWADTARGRLALIVVLDQFSRNMFRETPQAFAQDPRALDLCLKGLDIHDDQMLHPVERIFFYLPLEHAEDLEMQRRSIAGYDYLVSVSPAPLKPGMESAKDYAIQHFSIIERFGRFPHRNAILGRVSTPAEEAFLTQPGYSF